MFSEDLSVFFAHFAASASLNGGAVTAIVDTETVLGDDVLTQMPSALLRSSEAASASPGQSFVAASTNYIVRQVLREPPDGALTRLMLARV